MPIVTFFIVWFVIMKIIKDYEPIHKQIERIDNNPCCTVKSDKWKREHPEWKGGL